MSTIRARSRQFLCTAALGVHVFVKWPLFGKIIPATLVLGTMYVAPVGFVEGTLILGLIGTLMGWSRSNKKGARHT